MSDPIIVDVADEIATITLNRPERLNALDEALLTALYDATLDLCWHDDVRAIIITGAGRAFCAGGDLKSMSTQYATHTAAFHRLAGVFHQSVTELRRCAKPVIAAINGPAAGGGFSLALACDLRVMADDTFLQVAYVSNGLSIDGGGSWTLPRIVGYSKALELALTDEAVSAERALSLGLTNWVCRSDQLQAFAREKAEAFCNLPMTAIGRTKNLLNQSFDRELEFQLEEERRHLAAAAESPDGREGIEAFLEKRKPDYRKARS